MKTSEIKTDVVYEYNRSNDMPAFQSETLVVLDASAPIRFTERAGWSSALRTFTGADTASPAKRGVLAIIARKHDADWLHAHMGDLVKVSAADAIGKTEIEVRDLVFANVDLDADDAPSVNIIAAAPRRIRRTWEERDAAAVATEESRARHAQRKAAADALKASQWKVVRDALAERGIETDGYDTDAVKQQDGEVKTSVATLAAILGLTLPQADAE